MSRLVTGMTVESPGQGWCHTMRNVPDPGKKEGKTASQPQQIDRGLSEENKVRQLLLGASTALSILGLLTPCAHHQRVCPCSLSVCLSARRGAPRCPSAVQHTGGAVHSCLPACPKHAQLRCVPCRRPGNIPREASFSGLPGSEAAHSRISALGARPRTLYFLRSLRTHTVVLRFVRHRCMCN